MLTLPMPGFFVVILFYTTWCNIFLFCNNIRYRTTPVQSILCTIGRKWICSALLSCCFYTCVYMIWYHTHVCITGIFISSWFWFTIAVNCIKCTLVTNLQLLQFWNGTNTTNLSTYGGHKQFSGSLFNNSRFLEWQ